MCLFRITICNRCYTAMGIEKTGYCGKRQQRYRKPGDQHTIRSVPGWSCGTQMLDLYQPHMQAADDAMCIECRSKDQEQRRRDKSRQEQIWSEVPEDLLRGQE